MGMETIRQAVLQHHGGLQGASDAQIMIIWKSLPEQTQEKYLQAISKERKGKNAVSDASKRNVRSGS